MSQFCKHGREVYCPACEEDETMTVLDGKTFGESTAEQQPVMYGDQLYLYAVAHPFETVFAEYRNFVLTGADKKADSKFDSVADHHKALGAIGLAGEAGEVMELHNDPAATGLVVSSSKVLDLFKKQFFHTKEPENYREKVVKELGDVMWYFILKCAAEGITMDEVIFENMKKLVMRYPERHPELVEKFK